MIGKRRTSSDEGRASRRQRAIDVFAGYLERQVDPRELDEAQFTELLQQHPEIRTELRHIRLGLEAFRSLSPSRLTAALDARARRPWRTTVACLAAAVVMVAAIWGMWRFRSSSEAPTTIQTSSLTATLVGHCSHWLEDAVGPGSSIDRATTQSGIGVRGGRREQDPLLQQSITESVRGIAGFYAAVNTLAQDDASSTHAAPPPALAGVRAALVEAEPGTWRNRLLTSIDAPSDVADPGKPFLFALRHDTRIRALLNSATNAHAVSEEVARLIALATKTAALRLRAIDLDAGGVALSGARVFAQPVALPGMELGSPLELGATPLEAHELESGDWRITVVDESGPEARYSELRVLAMPGEDLGLRVVFLRRTADVIQGMAHREACSSKCGTPPDVTKGTLDLPETMAAVEELWIDPCEVTCEEYSAFYLDLQRHPEWFDGPIPVHRPRVLSEDGTCPRALARRPIVDVTWNEAVLYANWAGKRLPTEREWERVARGSASEDRRYPWGPDFVARRINDSATMAARIAAATAADPNAPINLAPQHFEDLSGGEVNAPEFEGGATPKDSGDPVFRLADNVSEFVEDLFVEGMSTSTPSLIDAGTVARVVKGGCWWFAGEAQSTTWTRSSTVTNAGTRIHGFRCLKTMKPSFETH